MLDPGKGGLKLSGNSKKPIPCPWDQQDLSDAAPPSHGQKEVATRFAFGSPCIDPSEPMPELRDRLEENVAGMSQSGASWTEKLLFHKSGIWKVKVVDGPDGTPYDGNDNAVLNTKSKYMFTWELLQETLDHQGVARTSIKGIFRAKTRGWLRNSKHLPDQSLKDEIKQVLDKSHVQDVFTDALFDYLTLLDIDYDRAFLCRCAVSSSELGSDDIHLLYDNACNLLHSILKRMPSMLLHYKLFVDSLHWAGHKDCSPYFNKAMSIALKGINSQLCEQRNRAINNMKTSAAFMSQPRGLVMVR